MPRRYSPFGDHEARRVTRGPDGFVRITLEKPLSLRPSVGEVGRLIKKFEKTRLMMKQMAKGKGRYAQAAARMMGGPGRP